MSVLQTLTHCSVSESRRTGAFMDMSSPEERPDDNKLLNIESTIQQIIS